MALITRYYANLTRSVKLMPWPGGHKVLFAAICDNFPTLDNVYKSPSAYKAHSHALTVSLYLFLLKPQVFHLEWIQKQPVIQHRPSVHHTDEPQSGQNRCLWLFHPLLDDWGGHHWLPQIGPCVPLAMVSVY